jgi:hypothetical protein
MKRTDWLRVRPIRTISGFQADRNGIGPFLGSLRYFLLVPRRIDRSPLRRAMQENRNSQRAETECGLRRIGRPSG